jgi:hypothetical protein
VLDLGLARRWCKVYWIVTPSSSEWTPTFWRDISPPPSGLKSKPSKVSASAGLLLGFIWWLKWMCYIPPKRRPVSEIKQRYNPKDLYYSSEIWDVIPCSQVEVYRHFRRTCCFYLLGFFSSSSFKDLTLRWNRRHISFVVLGKLTKYILVHYMRSILNSCVWFADIYNAKMAGTRVRVQITQNLLSRIYLQIQLAAICPERPCYRTEPRMLNLVQIYHGEQLRGQEKHQREQ